MTTNTVRVAAVQAEPVWFDLDATVDKTIRLIAEAAAAGAALVAFPEVWLPGYPVFIWLDVPQGGYTDRYLDNSLVVGSAQHRRIEDAARAHGIDVLLGFSEYEDGRIYMAQMLIDREGTTVMTRRKLKPSGREGGFYSPGTADRDLVVVDRPYARVGALNCSENRRPLLRHTLVAEGESLHVASWPAFALLPDIYAMSADACMATTSHYARETGIAVLAPTQVLGARFRAELATTPLLRSQMSEGGGATRIFTPDGRPAVTPLPHDAEGVLVADVVVDPVHAARVYDLAPLGPPAVVPEPRHRSHAR